MPQVDVDADGYIVVYDPDLIAKLDKAYHLQEKELERVSVEEKGLLGIKLRFMATDKAVSDVEPDGSHPVNSLCKC